MSTKRNVQKKKELLHSKRNNSHPKKEKLYTIKTDFMNKHKYKPKYIAKKQLFNIKKQYSHTGRRKGRAID